MNVLDVFKGDAFNVVELTTAMNLLPFKPSQLGAMGLFSSQGVTTNYVVIEERDGVLQLIPTQARGTPASVSRKRDRRARNFAIPHIPLDDTVLAAEVQGIRAFGSQSETEGVNQVVNDKLASMRQSHEVTLEWHRMGALKGVIYDVDGTTVLHNMYEEYDVHKQADMDWDIHTAGTSQKANCIDAIEKIEEALGATPYDHVHAICGKNWYKMFIEHALVKEAFDNWQNGAFLRGTQKDGFEFCDIRFERYRGKIATTDFIDDEEMRLFPVGVADCFKTFFGPADFIETVNTIGLEYYAKQERMALDKGIYLHTQSNPLCICTRPRVLIRGYGTS